MRSFGGNFFGFTSLLVRMFLLAECGKYRFNQIHLCQGRGLSHSVHTYCSEIISKKKLHFDQHGFHLFLFDSCEQFSMSFLLMRIPITSIIIAYVTSISTVVWSQF